ncbi:MFS transporter [Streptomyces radicis]|uniref:MFS transporter n=1 Tax=Streptomyces radicis TaxID=1750517 RepID=A0A3A9VSN3_9ACTN|nr:MFS transporter [Streptomyces radicis]RKN03572.1 MFS transporter [Streptomyces radicis]RKN13433.1 MFS transporter [Streptomyces radicis]
MSLRSSPTRPRRPDTRLDARFRGLAAAYGVSAYGTYLNLIALSLFSFEVTGTAFGVGAVMALRLLCGFAAGLAAGAVLARVSRRAVMIGADVAQGAFMVALAIGGSRSPLWLLGAAAVALGAGNTLFTVGLRSAVPVMVGQEARTRANGLLVTARSLATVLGFASAAPVIALGGYGLAFAVNAASFAVSAVVLWGWFPGGDGTRGAEDGGPEAAEERGGDGPSARRPSRRRILAGLPALLVGLVALRGVDALASSSHNVALPVVAHGSAVGEPALFMARFWAAWAIGTVLAQLVLRRRSGEKAWGERAFALGTCAMALSFIAAFLDLPAAALVLAALSAGFADGWTETVYVSRLQAEPARRRDRLFGLSATVEQSGFALGTVAAAAALEQLSALTVVAIFHGMAVCGALALVVATTGGGRGVDRARRSGPPAEAP